MADGWANPSGIRISDQTKTSKTNGVRISKTDTNIKHKLIQDFWDKHKHQHKRKQDFWDRQLTSNINVVRISKTDINIKLKRNPDLWDRPKLWDPYPSIKISVADPDPGSGAFLTPGSGISFFRIPDLRSQTHMFESLVTIFWVESSIILCNWHNFILCQFKIKTIFNFVIIVATKKVRQLIFFTPLFCCCVLIRDPRWTKIKIRDPPHC